jgi:hypothetical protein
VSLVRYFAHFLSRPAVGWDESLYIILALVQLVFSLPHFDMAGMLAAPSGGGYTWLNKHPDLFGCHLLEL